MLLKAGTYIFNDEITPMGSINSFEEYEEVMENPQLYTLPLNFTDYEGNSYNYMSCVFLNIEIPYDDVTLKYENLCMLRFEEDEFGNGTTYYADGHMSLIDDGNVISTDSETGWTEDCYPDCKTITVLKDTEVEATKGTWFIDNTNYNEVNAVTKKFTRLYLGETVYSSNGKRFRKLQTEEYVEPTLEAGLYDADDNLVASWDELVNTYGMKVDKNYSSIEVGTASSNPCYVLNNIGNGDKLIIDDAVTTLGNRAFSNCSSLTSVIIPNSVTKIGEATFHNCTSLTNIEIPDSIATIDKSAFQNCSSLTSVIIPNSVTKIGSGAFSGCSSLESVTLPFVGGSTSATVPSNDTVLGYIFGTSSYEGGTSTKQHYGYGQAYSTYYIPTSLKSVTITGGNILWGAFSYCSGLTHIEIPNSVTSIGRAAFACCESLTSIEIPNSVTSIEDHTLECCYSLTSIIIPNSVTSIGYGAFQYCTSLTSVVIGDSVTSIGNGAFSRCKSLISVDIPNSVTSIGDDAFGYCKSLEKVDIGGSVTSIGDDAFYSCDALVSVTIGSGVTSIGNSAFCNCKSLTSVIIPDSVTSIGEKAFYKCIFTSITIPPNISSIGNEALDIDSLRTITFKGNIPSYSYFTIPNLNTIVLADGVTSVGTFRLHGCDQLISVTISPTVTSIDDNAFYDCLSLIEIINKSSLNIVAGSSNYGDVGYYAKQVITDESQSALKTVDDYIFYDDGTDICLVKYFGNESEITLPEYDGGKAYEIYSNAFYDNEFTDMIIPNFVTSIGYCAFQYCYSLTSITIPDSVTSIGGYAFRDCSSLTSIVFTGTVDQWNEISLGDMWNYDVYVSFVTCADGSVAIERPII